MAKLKPNPMGATEDTETFEQKESVGDVLISVTGQRCTVEEVGRWRCLVKMSGILQVIWELLEGGEPRAVTEETIFCLILDCCRYYITLKPLHG